MAVLARAQQDAVWERTDVHNKLRALLTEFYPAMLNVVAGKRGGPLRPEVRTLLLAASTPTGAARLTTRSIAVCLRRAGRERQIEQEATRIRAVLRALALRQPPAVEAVMGQQLLALLRRFTLACHDAEHLADALTAAFQNHPAAEILRSFPGLGDLTAARLLAEVGDDRTRFRDARALKAYAGASPITRVSGRSHTVLARRVKNQRLAATGHHWSSPHSPARPEHASTTTAAEPPATSTPPLNDTCSTDSSAACITALQPAPSTTRPKRSQSLRLARLDRPGAWDASLARRNSAFSRRNARTSADSSLVTPVNGS